jgi:hypothetical protein
MAKDEERLRERAKELFDGYYKELNVEYGKILNVEQEYAEKVKVYLKK